MVTSEKINDYQQIQKLKSEKEKEFVERLAKDKPNGDSIEDIDKWIERADQLDEQHRASENDFDQQLKSLGTFDPTFYSDYTIPLYPTIVDDCEWLLKISKAFVSLLGSEFASGESQTNLF